MRGKFVLSASLKAVIGKSCTIPSHENSRKVNSSNTLLILLS